MTDVAEPAPEPTVAAAATVTEGQAAPAAAEHPVAPVAAIAPALVVAPEPAAAPAPVEFDVSLHEACLTFSRDAKQVELIAAFSREMETTAGGLKHGPMSAFRERFATFHTRPVVSEVSTRPAIRPMHSTRAR